MEQLELKHLAPYLPYGVFIKGLDKPLNARLIDLMVQYGVHRYTPILRPLSDLTKEIEYNGEKFVPILEWGWGNFKEIATLKSHHMGYIKVMEYYKLLECHFDVFGLIEKGLAIDINTLNR